MGTYTTKLNFYKADPTEFIDPDTQLNRNWDIADPALKSLMEYNFTSLQTPDTTNLVNRARFYKSYSNSVMARIRLPEMAPAWYQDERAFVTPWTSFSGSLINGYVEQSTSPVAYRVVAYLNGPPAQVELAGSIALANSGPIPLNTNTVFTSPIAPIAPVVSHYAMADGGNTTTDFCVARVLIGSDGHMEFKLYGVNPSSSANASNRIELNGIRYSIEIGA